MKPSFLSPLIGALTLSIFLVDAFTPLNIAIAVLYGAVILTASSVWSRRAIVGLTAFHIVLTLIAYGIGHRLDFFGPGFGRCLVSLSGILITAFLALRGQAATLALREREQALQLADQRKDEFLAMLAHELRNPIAPISGAAHLLKISVPQCDIVDETTGIIIRQADHLSGLVDDLLDLSRITRKLPILERAEVDMSQVVSDAVEQMRPLLDSARHQLAVELPEQYVLVWGDHKRLVQVLSNLLNNSVKYTPPGGQITLRMSAAEDQLLLEISDSGIGISAELLPHVFELFTQAERSADRTQGGLGIGLALVKSLVELHGGSVFALSKGANAGSTFGLRLPCVTKTMAALPSGDGRVIEQAGAPLRILVVDDNIDLAKMLAKFLVKVGHAATAIYASQEALDLAEREAFDVYLLDIGLPAMDGNTLVRRLREMRHGSSALMVAITGYGQRFDRRKAFEAGFDHYFVKPVDPSALLAVLEQWSSGVPLERFKNNAPHMANTRRLNCP